MAAAAVPTAPAIASAAIAPAVAAVPAIVAEPVRPHPDAALFALDEWGPQGDVAALSRGCSADIGRFAAGHRRGYKAAIGCHSHPIHMGCFYPNQTTWPRLVRGFFICSRARGDGRDVSAGAGAEGRGSAMRTSRI